MATCRTSVTLAGQVPQLTGPSPRRMMCVRGHRSCHSFTTFVIVWRISGLYAGKQGLNPLVPRHAANTSLVPCTTAAVVRGQSSHMSGRACQFGLSSKAAARRRWHIVAQKLSGQALQDGWRGNPA